MVACSDTFTPLVFPQLQTRPGAGDCGPAALGETMYIASCGVFKFNRWTTTVPYGRENRRAFVVKVRSLGGSPATGSSKTSEMHRAYTSAWAAARFAEVGKRPPRAKLMLGVNWTSVFKPELAAGRWASISVVYTKIDAFNGGAVSGQPGYTGNHQIVIGELRTKGGNEWVTMVDPLADGRWSGGRIVADGPQAIRLTTIRDAAEDFAGSGKATGYSFWPVAWLPGHGPGTGTTTTTVPNMVNVVEATALASLVTAELDAGNREEAYHASIVTGRVISSDPVAAVTVAKGSTVDYVVSLGTAPSPPVVDPDPPSPCTDPSGDVERRHPCGGIGWARAGDTEWA